MSTNTDYITRMEVQLRKWDADVDELRTRGKQMAVELRAGYFGRIKELRAQREEAQRRFHEMRSATEEAAGKLHAGMEGAWESMKSGLEKVSTDLSKTPH